MSDKRTHRDITVSVGHDVDRNVVLTVWVDMLQGESLDIVLSPDRAATLLRDLTNQTTYALLDAARSIAQGDCSTCSNVRMIKTVDRGRESNDHCPDCRIPDASFPPRPRVGGGVA